MLRGLPWKSGLKKAIIIGDSKWNAQKSYFDFIPHLLNDHMDGDGARKHRKKGGYCSLLTRVIVWLWFTDGWCSSSIAGQTFGSNLESKVPCRVVKPSWSLEKKEKKSSDTTSPIREFAAFLDFLQNQTLGFKLLVIQSKTWICQSAVGRSV